MDGPISQHHAVRQSYDAVAEEYLERFRDELAGKPLDRAVLAYLAYWPGASPEPSRPRTDAGKYRTIFWYGGDRQGDRMASRPGRSEGQARQ